MNDWSRRKFFLATLVGGVAAGAQRLLGATRSSSDGAKPMNDLREPEAVTQAATGRGTRPLIVCAANGFQHLNKGMEILKKGGDTLDAVLAVVVEVENDPNDNSVGYGGLPNEEGEVELDAQVMHGPTRRAGAVGALKKVKNASLVAKCVMEKTDHIFLVGEGATRFAIAEGFEPMDLLTPKSREAWLRWKAKSSPFWAPGIDSPNWSYPAAENMDTPEKRELEEWYRQVVAHPPTGTINCLAVDAKGDISGTTTTSGMAWKIPGRVGDSPVIGAGNYVDNEVGAAGSTGRGEENIRVCGAHTIVEMMRKGMSPTDACMEALQRIAHNFNNDKSRLTEFAIQFYALNKDGVHGGGTLWGTATGGTPNYAIHDGASARHMPFKALFDGASRPTSKTPQ